MPNLLEQLRIDFPAITFLQGDTFFWSPKEQTVHYESTASKENTWKLLHETAHGILGHTNYQTDFGLLSLEAQAWHKAKDLGKNYGITIDEDHVEDCLDSYRDWLHARSSCPTCHAISLQNDPTTYQCLNCHSIWHVSRSRFCRPYRRSVAAQEKKTI